MDKITRKLSKLKTGLRVLTLRPLRILVDEGEVTTDAQAPVLSLREHKHFFWMYTYIVPMSWTNEVHVYLYELKR